MAIGTRGLLVGAYLGIAGIVVLHQGSALLKAVVLSVTPIANVLSPIEAALVLAIGIALVAAALVLAIGVVLVAAAIALYSEHRWASPMGLFASGALAMLGVLTIVLSNDPVLWAAVLGSIAPTLLSGVHLARYEPTPEPRGRSRPGSSIGTRGSH